MHGDKTRARLGQHGSSAVSVPLKRGIGAAGLLPDGKSGAQQLSVSTRGADKSRRSKRLPASRKEQQQLLRPDNKYHTRSYCRLHVNERGAATGRIGERAARRGQAWTLPAVVYAAARCRRGRGKKAALQGAEVLPAGTAPPNPAAEVSAPAEASAPPRRSCAQTPI